MPLLRPNLARQKMRPINVYNGNLSLCGFLINPVPPNQVQIIPSISELNSRLVSWKIKGFHTCLKLFFEKSTYIKTLVHHLNFQQKQTNNNSFLFLLSSDLTISSPAFYEVVNVIYFQCPFYDFKVFQEMIWPVFKNVFTVYT